VIQELPNRVCPSAHELNALLHGNLEPSREQEVRTHADACGRCQVYLDQQTEDDELTRMLEEADDESLSLADDGTPQQATAPGFRVGRCLALGEQGVIFEATAESKSPAAVVKVARSPAARCRWRLEQEARILDMLKHPGIPGLIGEGWAETDRGRRYFLAVEYVVGVPITEFVRNRALDIPAKVSLLARVCDAVAVAHSRGIVHRDLKPANLLVTGEGQPVILDFGVAKDLSGRPRQDTWQTALGQLIGTLPYMSPEQVSGDGRGVDTRSDVFALGSILFELLTWRRPHDLSRATLTEAVRIISQESAPPLRRCLRSAPVRLEQIVGKTLALRKEDRYPDAGHLARDLRAFLADLGSGAHATPLTSGLWNRPVSLRAAGAGVGIGLLIGLVIGSIVRF
jgi:eukaryotic-like serine/threonine-protein kinase